MDVDVIIAITPRFMWRFWLYRTHEPLPSDVPPPVAWKSTRPTASTAARSYAVKLNDDVAAANKVLPPSEQRSQTQVPILKPCNSPSAVAKTAAMPTR